MKILLVNDSACPHTGGMNRVVVETCGALAGAGHEVALAYHDEHPVMVDCQTFHLPLAWSPDRRCRGLLDVIAAWRPEVVQSHSSKVVPALAEVSDRVPTCLFFHDLSWICSSLDRVTRGYQPCSRAHGPACLMWHYALGCGGKNPKGNWDRWWEIEERANLRRLRRARFQFASEFMRRAYHENGFAEEQTDLVPLFAAPPAGGGAVEAERGLVLLPSRLVPSKGVDVAIEALAGIRGLEWRLAIAGTGPQESELRKLAARSGLDGRVEFLGEVAPGELDRWYGRAQVVLFPVLRQEPFGLVGVEALAHGRPIVAFPGGAVGEWLWDGETGIAVRERSAAAFGNAVESLLRDPDRCRAMGQAARERAARFHPSAYLDRLVESFDRTRAWWGRSS